jgi:hypothetical protein
VTAPCFGAAADDVGAYLLAVRVGAWETEHPGWSVEHQADYGYWEALWRPEAQVVPVCRTSIEDLFERVDEVLATEAAAILADPPEDD